MKKLVIGLFVIGITSLGFSQNKHGKIKEEKLNDVVISNVNFNYLEKVQDSTTADFVKILETEASNYNVLKSKTFDGRNDDFEIIFRGTKGLIIATYDNNGKILKTSESYKDFKISNCLRNSVLKQFPNSSFLKVAYTVNYNNQNHVEKNYNIKIRQDNKVKNVKISFDNNVNTAVTMNVVD